MKNKTGIFHIPIARQRFFESMALASAGFTLPGYLAEALIILPIVTQGPYLPLASNIPLDKDNDLVKLSEVYGDPTLGALAWSALPFSLKPRRARLIGTFTPPRATGLSIFTSKQERSKASTTFRFVSPALTPAGRAPVAAVVLLAAAPSGREAIEGRRGIGACFRRTPSRAEATVTPLPRYRDSYPGWTFQAGYKKLPRRAFGSTPEALQHCVYKPRRYPSNQQ